MYDTDSDTNSSNGIDQKSKKLKADPDMVYKEQEDEPYHEEMLASELEALVIEKTQIAVEEDELDMMEKQMIQKIQMKRDVLKKRKQKIDTQIAQKRLKQGETSKTRKAGSK
ncbi:uncharacterized protein LOC119082835 isoform X2 [Bradysia coprophila]|uniref:uncharacterized protein LOC119082835 isoform X2 n=1 Tax=Bradysia coprophila TaxID=38358 RepID=UPI00187DCB60|nr:uncharacterized protein LOC119082835 isoform X2 [Bradysia coprophila]